MNRLAVWASLRSTRQPTDLSIKKIYPSMPTHHASSQNRSAAFLFVCCQIHHATDTTNHTLPKVRQLTKQTNKQTKSSIIIIHIVQNINNIMSSSVLRKSSRGIRLLAPGLLLLLLLVNLVSSFVVLRPHRPTSTTQRQTIIQNGITTSIW